MDGRSLSIGKNGRIMMYKCNRHGNEKARDYSGRLLDYEYTAMPCKIEPGTTLADIFLFMTNELATNAAFFNRLFPYSRHVPDILHAWSTYKKEEKEDEEVKYLEVSWYWIDIDDPDEDSTMNWINNMNFDAVGADPDNNRYGIEYSEPGDLAKYEIRVNPEMVFYRNIEYKTDKVVVRKIEPTLFNIISAILYELTWCGSQEERRKRISSLSDRLDPVRSFSIEEVEEELDLSVPTARELMAASEPVLAKVWDTPEEDVAWAGI